MFIWFSYQPQLTSSDGGEKQEKVEFHNIVAWAKLADICGQLLHKGDKVYVEGRLQTRDWKGDDGQDRKTTEIVIDNMMLLNSRSGGSNYSSEATEDVSSEPSAKPSRRKKLKKHLLRKQWAMKVSPASKTSLTTFHFNK